MQETGDLVGRAQRGDHDAFGALFRLHYPSVLRLARARLDPASAEDAAAETFARAWRALPRYRDTGAPFSAWLYGIARHVVADASTASRRTEPYDRFDDDPDRNADPWSASDDRLRLREAIAALPSEQRKVVELKYLMGLTNDEVASALGKKPGAVNTQQWRALRSLQRRLGAR